MKKRRKFILTTIMMLLFGFLTTGAVMAKEEDRYNTCAGEIVFLLDTSASMNIQDPDRLAADAVREAWYGLPKNWQTGLIAYGTDIQAKVPFGTEAQQMEEILENLTCSGYTNAGEGLRQAVELFTEDADTDRCIIMLTDGEIDMPDPQEKETSRSLYAEAAARAGEKGIRMYIVAIGSELRDPRMHIFAGAEETDGAIYWEGQSGTLSQIMGRILTERLDFPKENVRAEAGSLSYEIPVGAERVTCVLWSDQPIGEISADHPAEHIQIIRGQRYAMVQLSAPEAGTMQVQYGESDGAEIQGYEILEYDAVPEVTVRYRTEEIPRTEEEKNVPPVYEHKVDLTIRLLASSGDRENIWADTGFEGKEITLRINGETYTEVIRQGQIRMTLPADGIDHLEAAVEADAEDAVFRMEQPVKVGIERVPDPVYEPAPDYRPLAFILGILGFALLMLALIWMRKKHTTIIYMAGESAGNENGKPSEIKDCPYSGKLNLYVVRTEDGRDVPPQTYRLFGRQSGRLTLDQILTSCGIRLGKIGADGILLYPGPDHSLIVLDQTEGCTVMRGMEILKKGTGYPVYYNAKITVSFEDEKTEMELHYRNLKPGEREGIWE